MGSATRLCYGVAGYVHLDSIQRWTAGHCREIGSYIDILQPLLILRHSHLAIYQTDCVISLPEADDVCQTSD